MLAAITIAICLYKMWTKDSSGPVHVWHSMDSLGSRTIIIRLNYINTTFGIFFLSWG